MYIHSSSCHTRCMVCVSMLFVVHWGEQKYNLLPMISSNPQKSLKFLEINSLNKLTSLLEATLKLTQRGNFVMSSVLRTALQQGCRCGCVFVLSVRTHLCTSAFTRVCVCVCVVASKIVYLWSGDSNNSFTQRLAPTLCFNVIGNS